MIQGKQRQTTEQINQVDLKTHLLTIDDIVLVLMLVKFKKSLNVTDGEVVVPTKTGKGKHVQLHKTTSTFRHRSSLKKEQKGGCK